MVLDWKPLSAVFCSFLDGSFVEKIETFSDEQLLPFMPYLISTSFIPESDNCISEELLSRLVSFPCGNNILSFLSLDFATLEDEILSKKTNDISSFALADSEKKLQIVCRIFKDDPSEDSSLTTSFVTDDVFEEIGCILSLAVLHMPSIFNIEKLVMKLLSTNHGTDLLTLVIANMCELFHPVLSILLNIHLSDETPTGRQRSNLISNLIDLAPSIASSILSQMTFSRRDCMLAARIACSRLDDAAFCEFLVSQLVDKSTILAQNLNRSSSKHTMTLISNRLMKLADISVKNQSTEPLTDLMSSIVSLYLNCGLKLPSSDLSLLSAFICRKNIEDESHLVLALAALIAIPPFTFHNAITAPVPHTVDVHIVEWLSWLRMETNGCSRPVLSHALLFLGISLVNSRIDNLNLYLTEVLKCNKISIAPRHANQLRMLFMSSCLSEADLAVRCAALPVTPCLSATSGARLPIHSISDLMLTGAFTKHNVDIREWIEKQLMESVLPLHPQLADLVQKYAVDSARSEKEGLSRTFVEHVYAGELLDESLLTVRIIVLLFILAYKVHSESTSSKAAEIYPSEIFTRLPIRYLLSVVEIRCNDFQTARSYLVRLSTELFPYMMPTMDSLNIARSRTLGIAIKDTVGEMNDLLMSADPSVAMKAIQKLSTAPLSDQVRLLSCVGVAFLSSLNPLTLRPFIESVTSVWSKLESVVPRMLYENCAILWLDSSSKCDITVCDIYDYPSLLFRCDKRIFSSVAHFECFVRLVSFFEKASRTQLIRQIHCSTGQSSLAEAERMDREVLAHAFDHTQGSLIVQMLVEISDEKRMMDDPHNPCMLSTRLAIRKVACEFIHQLFIQDKNLMKLVLFQTLPTHMVRPLVDNVPSMFVAMDYMQEMLSLPDLNRRIFGVILMVEVARKYRIAASCVTIELVLDVLHTLMKYTEVSSSLHLFLSVVPTLTQLVTIFPQLSSDVTSMLQRVSTMAKARLALSTIVCRSKSCPERRLIDMIQQCLNAELNKDFN